MQTWLLIAVAIIALPWVLWGLFAFIGTLTAPLYEWRNERAFQRELEAIDRECEASLLACAADYPRIDEPIAK